MKGKKKEPKIQFTSFKAGIMFFALVNQFKRCSDQVENVHLGLLEKNLLDSEKAKESLEYNQDQKGIILAEMANLLNNHTKQV